MCSLAVTYKRIVPRMLHGVESSYEPNRGNISRKRKKPGAGTYKEIPIQRACLQLYLLVCFDLKPSPTYPFFADFFSKKYVLLYGCTREYIFIIGQKKIYRKQR